jgi:hypothetical protein
MMLWILTFTKAYNFECNVVERGIKIKIWKGKRYSMLIFICGRGVVFQILRDC